MKAYEIESPYTELFETDRLLLIFHPKLNFVLKGYLKQHYGVEIELKSAYEGGYFQVYPVKIAAGEENTSSTREASGKDE